jgi:two-component system, NarL family, sensor kinase
LIPDSESEYARRGDANPLLAKSALSGQMLWIDSRMRTTLGEEAGGLLDVQSRLMRHYFRLRRAERNLANLTHANRPPAGISAVRQIELERARLSRDLHTGVGQLLVAIRLQLEVIATQLTNAPNGVQQALNRIATLANDAGEQVRSLSRRLHPPEWQRLGLETAVQQLWESSGVPQRFEATLHIEPLPRDPEQETKVLVYRAAQEALTNLVRHARATRVEMTLSGRGDHVVLRIQDNGVGFDVPKLLSAPANVAQGIGLRSIREQALSLGGTLEIVSGGGGTKLELSAPLQLPQS